MITDAILGILADIASWFLGLAPEVPVPDFVDGGISGLGGVLGGASEFSYWFPVGFMLPALAVVMTAMATGFGVRAARVLLSLFSGGGGSAG